MSIPELIAEQRKFFNTGAAKEAGFRLDQLRRLSKALDRYEEDIYLAVFKDLHKPRFEMQVDEMALMRGELDCALANVEDWARPFDVPVRGRVLANRGLVYPEPYGVSMIMAPWNYPFLLLISPLIGSIAAGNCSVLKPSGITENSSRLRAEMIADTFDSAYIAVVEGGAEVSRELLAEKFDYIFFTGSGQVGKSVMHAAADHLTPVTLELGGKSPCIVDSKANIDNAANRIVWGKFMNAGQTCIAPDYLIVQETVKGELLLAIQKNVRMFYGENPMHSSNYARIINKRHFERLSRLLDYGNIIAGGRQDASQLYIEPTVMEEVTLDGPLMQEEIFGPILPVFTFVDLADAIADVNSRPKPLALYFFSSNLEKQMRVLKDTTSGGVTINSTLLHASTQPIPYGGGRESGRGG